MFTLKQWNCLVCSRCWGCSCGTANLETCVVPRLYEGFVQQVSYIKMDPAYKENEMKIASVDCHTSVDAVSCQNQEHLALRQSQILPPRSGSICESFLRACAPVAIETVRSCYISFAHAAPDSLNLSSPWRSQRLVGVLFRVYAYA